MTDATQPTPEERARYESLKKELVSAIPRRRALDKHLAEIEVNIHKLEGAYLNETAAHTGGNIITGFEGYLKNPGANTRRKYELSDHDRLFSSSSLTTQKALDLQGDGEDDRDSNGGSSTIILPPSGSGRSQSQETSHQRKLKRDADYQRKRRAQANSRGRSMTVDSEEEPQPSSASARRPTKRQRMEED